VTRQPCCGGRLARFESGDDAAMFQGKAKFVEPFERTAFAEDVDVECMGFPVKSDNVLRCKVADHMRAGA
jgi:hypothetical protein